MNFDLILLVLVFWCIWVNSEVDDSIVMCMDCDVVDCQWIVVRWSSIEMTRLTRSFLLLMSKRRGKKAVLEDDAMSDISEASSIPSSASISMARSQSNKSVPMSRQNSQLSLPDDSLDSQFQTCMDDLEAKRSNTRVTALATLVKVLSTRFVPDSSHAHARVLLGNLRRSLKRDDPVESSQACRGIKHMLTKWLHYSG